MGLVAAWFLTSTVWLAQTPPPPPPPPPTQSAARDLPYRAPVGRGTLQGRVVSDDAEPKPLRRATVQLRSDGARSGWSLMTDDTGTFEFSALPAGRYTLSASKPTYVNMVFGALKPGRPGQSIVLGDGEVADGLTVKLPKGAVITGVVRDESGAPAENIQMGIQRVVMSGSQRSLAPASYNGTMRTDDKGVYRIFGLAAGEYVVSANTSFFVLSVGGGLHRQRAAEIEAALRRDAPADSGEAPAELLAAQVYFGGVTSSADAATVTVTIGEERTGIDITLQYVPASTVEGRVQTADGRVPAPASVQMFGIGGLESAMRPQIARLNAQDGSFVLTGVAPGRHLLVATANPPGASALYARTELTVTGRRPPTVSLTLEPGVTVSGTLTLATGSAALDLKSFQIGLDPIIGKNDVAVGVSPIRVNASNGFIRTDVPPGRYRMSVLSTSTVPFRVTRILVNGVDVVDDGFDVGSTDISGVSVELTSAASEISGVLQDASGRPAPDYYIIAFPSDPRYWYTGSRRIRTARPDTDGRYVVRNLPPGEYHIAAVTDVETNEWFEPSFLQPLVAASAVLTLGDGERKSFPLAIRK